MASNAVPAWEHSRFHALCSKKQLLVTMRPCAVFLLMHTSGLLLVRSAGANTGERMACGHIHDRRFSTKLSGGVGHEGTCRMKPVQQKAAALSWCDGFR